MHHFSLRALASCLHHTVRLARRTKGQHHEQHDLRNRGAGRSCEQGMLIFTFMTGLFRGNRPPLWRVRHGNGSCALLRRALPSLHAARLHPDLTYCIFYCTHGICASGEVG